MKFHGIASANCLAFYPEEDKRRKKYIAGMKENQHFIEEIKKVGPEKTQEQLGYYHAVVLPVIHKQLIADGHEVLGVPITEDMADAILKKVCHAKNKRDMTQEEATEFITKCIHWAATRLGCCIPPPDRNHNGKRREEDT